MMSQRSSYSEVAQLVEHPAVNRQVAGSSPAFGAIIGPLVKRLRHRPFTAVTRVRIPYGSPLMLAALAHVVRRRISSAGRAPALQAGGRRFDPVILHHFKPNNAGVAQLVEQLTCNQ